MKRARLLRKKVPCQEHSRDELRIVAKAVFQKKAQIRLFMSEVTDLIKLLNLCFHSFRPFRAQIRKSKNRLKCNDYSLFSL